MILRPQRYRTLMGFLAGLLISLILLAVGYAYYRTKVYKVTEAEKNTIAAKAVDDYIQKNPTKLVYLFSAPKKSGDVLSDSDIMPSEISANAFPDDAVTDPAQVVGKVLRCNISPRTIVTGSLIYEEKEYPDDARRMEYTVINLPEKLEALEFIDIRIMFPNGLDYIVLSKKQVSDIKKAAENQKSIVWLNAGEEEILRMASAIVDASVVEGAILYAVPYIAPDIQNEAIKTYPTNIEVQNLILQNPNIVKKAITQLEARNRKLFEERINKDMINSGRKKIFGDDIIQAPPPPSPTPSPSAQPENSALDGRGN